MATYEVKSGKHHIPSVKNKRVVLTTFKPGDRFTAEKWQVRNCKDKFAEIKEVNNEVKQEKLNERIKGKFKREKNACL